MWVNLPGESLTVTSSFHGIQITDVVVENSDDFSLEAVVDVELESSSTSVTEIEGILVTDMVFDTDSNSPTLTLKAFGKLVSNGVSIFGFISTLAGVRVYEVESFRQIFWEVQSLNFTVEVTADLIGSGATVRGFFFDSGTNQELGLFGSVYGGVVVSGDITGNDVAGIEFDARVARNNFYHFDLRVLGGLFGAEDVVGILIEYEWNSVTFFDSTFEVDYTSNSHSGNVINGIRITADLDTNSYVRHVFRVNGMTTSDGFCDSSLSPEECVGIKFDETVLGGVGALDTDFIVNGKFVGVIAAGMYFDPDQTSKSTFIIFG